MQIVYRVAIFLALPFIALASSIKNKISYSIDAYSDNVGVFIFSPVATLQKKLDKHFAYIASLRIDGISAASIRNGGGRSADYVTADAVSGASGRLGFQDLRVAPTLTFLYEADVVDVSVGTYISNEIDFNAISGFMSTSLKLNDGNSIFGLGGSYGYEIWNPSISRALAKNDKIDRGLNASYMQLITPKSYAQLRYSFNSDTGYLASPYHVMKSSTFTQYDRYPAMRNAHALALQYVHEIVSGWALHGQYRYYTDDWAQRSHMFEFKSFHDVSDVLTLSFKGRYYTQSDASFVKALSDYKVSDDYIVSSYRLTALGTYGFGVGFSYKPESLEDKDFLINASWNYYTTDKNNYIQAWYGTPAILATYMTVGISYDY